MMRLIKLLDLNQNNGYLDSPKEYQKLKDYLYATERIFRGDSDKYLSMNEPKDYGNIIYELALKRLLKQGHLLFQTIKFLHQELLVLKLKKLQNQINI